MKQDQKWRPRISIMFIIKNLKKIEIRISIMFNWKERVSTTKEFQLTAREKPISLTLGMLISQWDRRS